MKRLGLSLVILFHCGGDAAPPKAAPPPPVPSASAAPSASASAAPVAEAPDASVPAPPPGKPIGELEREAMARAAEALNRHDAAAYAELFTNNAVHREASARDVIGKRDIGRRMQGLFASFPDFKFSVDRLLQKDNIAVAQWRWTGTDTGGFMGKKPSRRRAGVQGVGVAFFNADGHIREIRVYEDGQDVVAQLDPAAKPGAFRAAATDSTTATEFVTSTGGPEETKNADAAKALYDAIEAKDAAAGGALFTDDAALEDFGVAPRALKGPAAYKAIAQSWTASFGAFTELPLYNLMTVGDWIVAERVLKGTASSGAFVNLHCADIGRLKDGKFVSFSSYSNGLELVNQVGNRGVRK